MDVDALLDLAISTAHEAGSLLIERFDAPARGVGSKSTATDLVSDADRDSEAAILAAITEARPDDGVLGEEGTGKDGSSGFVWTIDPLDGTVNFLYGIPWWAISIALRDPEGDLLGVVHNPILGETFSAVRGEGAWLNGADIRVGNEVALDKALIGTGFAYGTDARRVQAEVVARVLPTARDVRRMGSAALDLCSLACGRLDGFYESHLEEWDKAAGRLIVTEAGGRVSEIEPPVAGLAPGLAASNPALHAVLLELIEGRSE